MSASGEKAAPHTSHAGQPRFAIAAIDLDDTLVGRDGAISPANAEAVRRLVAMGTRVLLASGRSHANMLPFHRHLGLPAGPIISAQGAVAQDSHSGAVWFEVPIPTAEVAEVTRDGHANGFAVQHYRPTGIHAAMRTQWTEYDQSRNAEPHRYVDDLLTSGATGSV